MKPKEAPPQPAPLELVPHGDIAKKRYDDIFKGLNEIASKTGVEPEGAALEAWERVAENGKRIEELNEEVKKEPQTDGEKQGISQAFLEIERLSKENETLAPKTLRAYKALLASKGVDADDMFEAYERGLLTSKETRTSIENGEGKEQGEAKSLDAAIAKGKYKEMQQRIEGLVEESKIPLEGESLRLWRLLAKRNKKIQSLHDNTSTDEASTETRDEAEEAKKLIGENDVLFADFLETYAHLLKDKGVDPEQMFSPREKGLALSRTMKGENQEAELSIEPPAAETDSQVTAKDPSVEEILAGIRRIINGDLEGGLGAVSPLHSNETIPTTSTEILGRDEAYSRYKETLKKRMREESDARAKKGVLRQLGTSDKKISRQAEKTNGVIDARAEYLSKTEKFIEAEKARIRKEIIAKTEAGKVPDFEGMANAENQREQQIRAEAAMVLYQARKDAQTEILPTKAREAVKRGTESFARYNKDHWWVKYAVGASAIFAGATVASTVGIAPALTAGVFATRWAGASMAIYCGLAPKMMGRQDKKRGVGKEAAIEGYREKFKEKLALLNTQEEVDKAWEDLQKEEKWYDTKTKLLGIRDTMVLSAGIGGGLTAGFSWWFFGGGGAATEAITATTGEAVSTPGISRISHEGMLTGEPTKAPTPTPGISRISHEGMLGGEPTEAPKVARAPLYTKGVPPTITKDTPTISGPWQGIDPEGLGPEGPRGSSPSQVPPPPESVIRRPRTGSGAHKLEEYPQSSDTAERWSDALSREPRPDEPQYPPRTGGKVAGESPEAGAVVPPGGGGKSMEPVIHKLGKGEGVIKSLELEAKKMGLFKNLPGKEAQTNFIQNRYAMMKNFSAADLKEIATQPDGRVADLNNLKPGDQLNLTRFFEDQSSVDKGIARSANLSPEEVRRIGENNKIIADRVAEWKEVNPGKRLGDANIENMLKPKTSLPGAEAASLEHSNVAAGDIATQDVGLAPGVEAEASSPSISKEPIILGSEVRAAYTDYLNQKFPSKSFLSFLPWDKKGIDSLEWSQARNFSALEVDKFKGVYGGPGGKDNSSYYGKIGPSPLRSQDFSKIQEVVAELKQRSGLIPDKTESVEEFAKRAVEETFLNARLGKPTY